MTFLSRDQVADLRRMSEETMPHTCSIIREGEGEWVDTGGGSGYYDPTSAPIEFPCRLSPISGGDEVEIAERPDVLQLVKMTYPISVEPIRASDKPVIDGEAYEVVGVPHEQSIAIERHATLRKVV